MQTQVISSTGEQRTTIYIEPGMGISFTFDLSGAVVERVGNNLVLTLENGNQLVLEGFFVPDQQGVLPEMALFDGTIVNSAEYLAALEPDLDLSPSADGGIESSGFASYADNSGSGAPEDLGWLNEGFGNIDITINDGSVAYGLGAQAYETTVGGLIAELVTDAGHALDGLLDDLAASQGTDAFANGPQANDGMELFSAIEPGHEAFALVGPESATYDYANEIVYTNDSSAGQHLLLQAGLLG